MFFDGNGKRIHPTICCDNGFNKVDELLLELIKYMQMQINRLEKDNRNIKRELNRLKKQVRKSRLGG